MSKTITIEKFSRYLGEHERMSSEEKVAHARHLMFLHKDGLKYGKTIVAISKNVSIWFVHIFIIYYVASIRFDQSCNLIGHLRSGFSHNALCRW